MWVRDHPILETDFKKMALHRLLLTGCTDYSPSAIMPVPRRARTHRLHRLLPTGYHARASPAAAPEARRTVVELDLAGPCSPDGATLGKAAVGGWSCPITSMARCAAVSSSAPPLPFFLLLRSERSRDQSMSSTMTKDFGVRRAGGGGGSWWAPW